MTVRGKRLYVIGGIGLLLGGSALWASSKVCLSAWLFQGVHAPYCPDGRFRQRVELSAWGMAREGTGHVSVKAMASGMAPKPGLPDLNVPVHRLEAALVLVDSGGKETPLSPVKGWAPRKGDDGALDGEVKLPALPDGDYTLRARVTTPLGTDSAEATLALYAPARVHVLTDRPLYEPGNQVRFRAVALRAKDLAPLDNRPGTWRVYDATGELVLEEKAPAGPWGVVADTFPLDRGAPTGTWKVRWESGGASGEAPFRVEPFTLPRFRVEASSPKPFWRAGETPSVEGLVVYSSGAPVTNAEVTLAWTRGTGAWPPPVEWLSGGLPQKAKTDAAGRFKVTLPMVPHDLRGQATLNAQVSAQDGAGDRVQGGLSLLLAEDALSVSAVTELEDGLVQNFSNRVFLRATTPDGQVLPGAELTVKRAWDPKDAGVRAVTDEDGVAALQLDPGVPVNVVVPPMPVRRAPRPTPVSLSSTRDFLTEDAPSLEDQVALQRWLPGLYPCARFVSPETGSTDVQLAARVGANGAVAEVVGVNGPLAACMAEGLRSRTLPAGHERLLSLSFQVMDPGLPMLALEGTETAGGAEPTGLDDALTTAALDARTCLPSKLEVEAPLPMALTWRVHTGKAEVAVSWAALPKQEEALSASVMPCLQAHFAKLSVPLPKESDGEERQDGLGVTRFTAQPPGGEGDGERPQATTLLGYELKVSAKQEGHDAGSTKLVLRPAELPPTRLRATPVLARAGEEVKFELLRGPHFEGKLPQKLFLQAGTTSLESKVEGRVARFTLPRDFEGWAEARWEGALARVYVAPRAQLTVEVGPEKPAYMPGEVARLQVRTRVDGQDGPAAVGLFGVDETLSQLAALPGADTLGSLRPAPTVATPAFGVLDGQALAMGRIRGGNAAAAALLRVSGVPTREEVEAPVSTAGASPFLPDVELTDAFYRVLAELNTQVRAWEKTAPEGETLSPAGQAKLWEQALAACEKRGEPVTDAYGRRLRLSRLPQELLALTDPRFVVVSGTRLSEDVENWGAWVAREAP